MSGRTSRPPRPDEFPSLSRAAQMTPTQAPPTRTPPSSNYYEPRGAPMRGSSTGPPISIARRGMDELPRRPAAASPVSAPSSSPSQHIASPARSAPSTAASTPSRPPVSSVSAPTTPAVTPQGDGSSGALAVAGVDWASAALDEEMDFEKPLMFADSSPADEARLREQAAVAEAQRLQEEEEERERERQEEAARAKVPFLAGSSYGP